jgi:opacity protein-like surface antigen
VDVGPHSIDSDAKEAVIHANLYWQAYKEGGYTLDIYGGVRYAEVNLEIDLVGGGLLGATKDIDENESWIEPLVGVRTRTEINGAWSIITHLDVGGFGVGSDFTWHMILGLDHKLGENWSAKYAYRHLDIDYDDDGFIFDTKTYGPVIGMTYSF